MKTRNDWRVVKASKINDRILNREEVSNEEFEFLLKQKQSFDKKLELLSKVLDNSK